MNKKGDISMNTIIAAAIAIMVLIVVIMIFTNNIKKPAGEMEDISKKTGSLSACESELLNRHCFTSAECKKTDGKQGTHLSFYDNSCEKDPTTLRPSQTGNFCCDFS